MDSCLTNHEGVCLQRKTRVLAYRSALAGDAPSAVKKNWAWKLCLWGPGDRVQFAETMQAGWCAMQRHYPFLRRKDYRKYSPNVYATPEQWEQEQENQRVTTKETQ
jgi:hypothetical protein